MGVQPLMAGDESIVAAHAPARGCSKNGWTRISSWY
jgi:hypothetical protein